MKRNILRWWMVFLAFAVTFGAVSVFADEAEEEKPTASLDVGILNNYIWRGYQFSDDSMVIQPSMTVGYKGFSVNLWGNLDTSFDDTIPSTNNQAEFNETDLTLAYDTTLGAFDLGVGYIYYGLDGIPDTEELYVSVCANAIPLAPTLTIYRDINEVPGWYLNLGLSHSIDLGNDITLDLGGSAGYYYSESKALVEFDNHLVPTTKKYRSLHDGMVCVGMTIPLDKYFTLSPMVAYSFPLVRNADDHIEGMNAFGHESEFVIGAVSLSLAF